MFANADGSTHFVTDSIDWKARRALLTFDGVEIEGNSAIVVFGIIVTIALRKKT